MGVDLRESIRLLLYVGDIFTIPAKQRKRVSITISKGVATCSQLALSIILGRRIHSIGFPPCAGSAAIWATKKGGHSSTSIVMFDTRDRTRRGACTPSPWFHATNMANAAGENPGGNWGSAAGRCPAKGEGLP